MSSAGVQIVPEAVSPRLPPVPRALTPAARKRGWIEPRVRAWWLAAAVPMMLFLIICYEVVTDWRRFVDLIENGIGVSAIVQAQGYQPGHRLPPDTNFTLTFPDGSGTGMQQVNGPLLSRTDLVRLGDTVDIRIDKDDPTRWTDLSVAPRLLPRLTGSLAILPFVALALGIGFVARSRVLTAWRDGVETPARVVDTAQAALAPKSTLVSCSVTGGRDQTVVRVYVPHHKGIPQKGEEIRLLIPPANALRALAADAFV